MPDYDWSCLACEKTVSAGLEACDGCGCPCDVSGAALAYWRRGKDGQRSDGLGSIPWRYLLLTIIGAPLMVVMAWNAFTDQTAQLDLFRYGIPVEVSGPLSSLFGALAMIALAVTFGGLIAARFDWTQKTNRYRGIVIRAVLACVVLMVLAIAIGWQFEHIRVVPGWFG